MQATESTPPDAEASDVLPLPEDDDAPSMPSTDAFGRAFRAYAERKVAASRTLSDAASDPDEDGEDDDQPAADESAQPDAADATKSAGEPPEGEQPPKRISRTKAVARVGELEQEVAALQAKTAELETAAETRAEQIARQRDEAQQALARRQAAEAEIAKQDETFFGKEDEYQRLKSLKARNQPLSDDYQQAAELDDKLATWEQNRGLIPAAIPRARLAVLSEWQQFVSERALELAKTLPGVKADELHAAVNPDDLFTAYYRAGERGASDLPKQLATEKAAREKAEQELSALRAQLRTAKPRALGASREVPRGGESASTNGTSRLDRRTASGTQLLHAAFSRSA